MASQPVVIDITDADASMLPGFEDMPETGITSSLDDADPELKWALEASLGVEAEGEQAEGVAAAALMAAAAPPAPPAPPGRSATDTTYAGVRSNAQRDVSMCM